MNNKKKAILSIVFALYLIAAFFYIDNKQKQNREAISPDLDRLVHIRPEGWYPIESLVTDPGWKKSANQEYDQVSAKTYENKQGDRVTVVITWSRNGVQRAGHIQQLCYSAQGFNISNVHDITFDISGKKHTVTAFSANRMTGNIEDVLYWRVTDGKLMSNVSDIDYGDFRLQHRIFKMYELLKSVFGKIPDNIMIRISSTRTIDTKEQSAQMIFTKQYLNMLDENDKKILMAK